MRVLVTGGAGYVGSVSVERLVAAGHDVVVLDSLVTGHRASVPREARLVVESTRDQEAVERLLRRAGIDAILHCAARSLVPESMSDPALYYAENVGGGVALLDAMLAADVGRIVFSSTAAVYGEPEPVPIPEDAPLRPINPYGETKRAFEGAMRWYAEAFGLRCVSLRYFNVAGATETRGEDHRPETHLVPNILRAALGDGRLTIHGDDYPTPDGTPIRDYIHVEDLADAHLAALELEAPDGSFTAINLGSGSGFTVHQVLAAAEAITGREIPREVGPRRPGDPPALVASNELARRLLGWEPLRGTLEEMIGSAWRWREAHPHGYTE
jgi:UDP-glucose-4-epimerase GalE